MHNQEHTAAQELCLQCVPVTMEQLRGAWTQVQNYKIFLLKLALKGLRKCGINARDLHHTAQSAANARYGTRQRRPDAAVAANAAHLCRSNV